MSFDLDNYLNMKKRTSKIFLFIIIFRIKQLFFFVKLNWPDMENVLWFCEKKIVLISRKKCYFFRKILILPFDSHKTSSGWFAFCFQQKKLPLQYFILEIEYILASPNRWNIITFDSTMTFSSVYYRSKIFEHFDHFFVLITDKVVPRS